MIDFLQENWKNISLMFMLLMITVYFIYTGQTEYLAGTIIPMLAVGLNLESKK
jgi:hypothetical protein